MALSDAMAQAPEPGWATAGLLHASPPSGQLKGIEHDCNDIPDAGTSLAVAAISAQGPTAIKDVYNVESQGN